jgi:hypothetical protein
MFVSIKRSVPYIAFREWQKALRRRLQLPRYRGTQYRCPICHVTLRAFKPTWRSYWIDYQQYEWIHSPFANGDVQPRRLLLPAVRFL